jgi:hypothetical protein
MNSIRQDEAAASEPTARRGDAAGNTRRRVAVAVVVACLVLAGIGLLVWRLDAGGQEPALNVTAGPGTAAGVRAEIVSAKRLAEIAHADGRVVYWAERRSGTRIEYTETADGSTYVRYLTGKARAGSPRAGFVVVATYPRQNAYREVTDFARKAHVVTVRLPNGGLAVTKPGRPQNIYIVYADQPYQVEVYAPSASTTRRLVFGGRIRALR